MISALPTYLMLSPDFGAAGAALNRLSFAAGRGDVDGANRTFQSAYLFLFIMSFGVTFLGILSFSIIPIKSLLNLETLTAKQSVWILAFLLLSISVNQLTFVSSAFYRSASKNARFAFIQSGRSVAQLLLLGLLYLGSWSPVVYAASQFGVLSAFLIAATLDGKRLKSGLALGYRAASFAEVKSLIRPGLGFAVYPLIHSIQNQGMLLLAGSVLGPVAAASFQAMRTMANTSRSLFGIFVGSIQVEAAKTIGESGTSELGPILEKLKLMACAFFVVGIVVTFTIAQPIFRWWAGAEASWSAPLVVALLLSILGISLASVREIVINARNLIHRIALPLVFLLVAHLGLTYGVLNKFGFGGLVFAQGIWGLLFLGLFSLPYNRALSQL